MISASGLFGLDVILNRYREETVGQHYSLYKNRKAKIGPAFILITIITMLFSVLAGLLLIDRAFSAHHLDFFSFYKFQDPRDSNPKTTLAKGKYLIAAQKLTNTYFSETVVLLVDYSPTGAMGLIVNRPTKLKLSTVLPKIKGLEKRPDTLYSGGPVAGNRIMLLVRSNVQPEKAFHVFGNVYFGANWTVIQQMIDRSDSKERFRTYAGYSGWSPAQLDNEVSRGAWHILSADEETLFDKTPSEIWPELNRRFSSQWVKASN